MVSGVEIPNRVDKRKEEPSGFEFQGRPYRLLRFEYCECFLRTLAQRVISDAAALYPSNLDNV